MSRIFLSLLLGATIASAADQTLLGTQLLVKNPSTPEKRLVVGQAKELNSPNTIVGDPVTNGAGLTVRAEGATPSEQTFTLPQGTNVKGKQFWTGDATAGFKYNDPAGENGPVKKAQLKKSSKGVFAFKFAASGKLGTISVLPPNAGDGGCILLQLGLGDSYSIRFAQGDGQVSNKGATVFKVKKPQGEGTCVTTTTSAPTTSTTSTTDTTTTTVGGPTTTTLFAGPDFPPTGGSVMYNFTGDGQTPAGANLDLFNFSPTTWTALYWGVYVPYGPQAGLDGSLHNLSFQGITGGGTVVTWQGNSPWTDPSDNTVYVVPVRLTITLVTPPVGVLWIDSTTVTGLDPGAGTGMAAAVNVAPAGTAQNFTVNFQYSADLPTDGPGFIAFSNVPTIGGGQTQSSFSGGFYSQP